MAWPELNPSQWLGVSGFMVSAVACGAAGVASGSPWPGLALAQVACLTEVVFGGRLVLHDLVNEALQRSSTYGSREQLQLPALASIAVALVSFLVLAGFSSRGRSLALRERVALVATVCAGGLFAVEAVSLHAIDRVMYRGVGPFLIIALLWFGAAITAACAAWRALQR